MTEQRLFTHEELVQLVNNSPMFNLDGHTYWEGKCLEQTRYVPVSA